MTRALTGVLLTGFTLFGTTPTAAADQVRDKQWAWPYTDYSVSNVWRVSQGRGVIVAVVGEGVDAGHPDLTGQVLAGEDPVHGGDGRKDHGNDGHGTAMAALIAGHGHGRSHSDGVMGLAPEAKILPVSKVNAAGHDNTAAAIRFAVDHGASVVDLSIGDDFGQGRQLEEAVAYARTHDVLLIASAGNSGAGRIEYPAAEPGVVAVGGIGENLRVWSGSNYGRELLLTAPATDIVSADPTRPTGYSIADGTSNAAAYVSAAAALVRARFPHLTAGQVVNRLVRTALVPRELRGKPLPDPHYGYGIIRPYRALTAHIPAGPENGPLPALIGAATGSTASAPPTASGDGPARDTGRSPGHSAGTLVGLLVTGLLTTLAAVLVAAAVSRARRRSPGGPGAPTATDPGPPADGGPYASGGGQSQRGG